MSQKSKTPTSSSMKSNRFAKLLKKKKKGRKSKSSKSQHHLQINDETHTPPVIRHRTSSPFIATSTTMNNINIERYHSSSCSEHEESTPQTQTLRNTRSLSHHQYNSSKLDKLNINTNKRNIPPPPPPKKSLSVHNIHSKPKSHHTTSTYQHQNDRNININIDINKNHHKLTKRSNTRRSRRNSIDTDSPTSPQSPQSPAARFISHIPRESIEHKINIKQLLFEMIEMKRQIKSLKKDMKYLKTENDLCHRRINFLEQTIVNKNDNKHKYSHYLYNNNNNITTPPEINLHPQPPDTSPLSIMGQMNLGPSQIQNIQTRPKRLSLSKQTQMNTPNIQPGIERSASLTSMQSPSIEPVELDLSALNNHTTRSNDDIETKLRKLSHKLSNANVFSNEYKRLEYELNKYEENVNKNKYEENINKNSYYDKENEYNNGTMIIHKNKNDKRLYCMNSNNDDEKDKYGHGKNTNTQMKSLCRLSRRTTKGYKNKHIEKQIVHKYSNETIEYIDSGECEYPSTLGEGMEIID